MTRCRREKIKKAGNREMELLDIHTHHAQPQPQGVIVLRVGESAGLATSDAQLYSVGIHPWDTVHDISEDYRNALTTLASRSEIVAIGETGIDLTPRGGPMFRQMQVFKMHIDLSESLCKPLVIHDVKGDDIVIGAKRDYRPKQNWVIHGFRRKPSVAEMLLRAGCWLSFGAEFNPEALKITPEDRILAETDDTAKSIEEVIAGLSASYGKDLTATIAANTRKFLGI